MELAAGGLLAWVCEPFRFREVGQAAWAALRQRPCQVMAANGQDRGLLKGSSQAVVPVGMSEGTRACVSSDKGCIGPPQGH